jgi:glucosamine--fructose-6-phosphate aminotransferase (isomerizing)
VGKGFTFVSETDTEVVPKLLMYLHQQHQGSISLPRLAMEVMLHLEGAFALLIKSTTFYPGQLVACKRGSPLVYATKAAQQGGASMEDLLKSGGAKPGVNEVWLASDAAALLTHSREMTVLDDEDLLHVGADGSLAHFNLGSLKGTVAAGAQPGALRGLAANLGRDLSVTRLARTVSMELESVMKVGWGCFGGPEGRRGHGVVQEWPSCCHVVDQGSVSIGSLA